jgi:uncharacterized glyoxalase superfamily protein PhnB
MKATPRGWPRISSSVFYEEAGAAIDWLCSAFGFEVRLRVDGEGGRVEHAELTYGDGLMMIGSSRAGSSGDWRDECASPRALGGKNTQSLCLFVDDVDAHCAAARAAGAEIVTEPTTKDYGDEYWSDRSYLARDREGHLWWFMQRMREQGAHGA